MGAGVPLCGFGYRGISLNGKICVVFSVKYLPQGLTNGQSLWYTYSDKNEAGGLQDDERNYEAEDCWLLC